MKAPILCHEHSSPPKVSSHPLYCCVCVSDKNTYKIYPLSKRLSVQCSIVNSGCSAVQESRTYSGEGFQVRRPLHLHLLSQVNLFPLPIYGPQSRWDPPSPEGRGALTAMGEASLRAPLLPSQTSIGNELVSKNWVTAWSALTCLLWGRWMDDIRCAWEQPAAKPRIYRWHVLHAMPVWVTHATTEQQVCRALSVQTQQRALPGDLGRFKGTQGSTLRSEWI